MNNSNTNAKKLSPKQRDDLLKSLKSRFEKNLPRRQAGMYRHDEIIWGKIQAKLEANPPAGGEKLWSLSEMERTGGEPDVVKYDAQSGEFIFCDCSDESPKGRRSLCYDRDALNSRKEFKPKDSAVDMAKTMGIELLTEEQYRELQTHGEFDTKTSIWLKTPDDIRKLGGAIFADRRYNHVFVFHNGADSYYGSRGFRGLLRV